MYLISILPLLLVSMYRTHGRPSSWFYEMAEDDEPLTGSVFSNVFYDTFKQMQDRIHAYAPALHVGKINRGSFQKPELVHPKHRAMGWDSDFHHQDADAFRYTPTFPNQQCMEIKRTSTSGFDCRCGVPRRKDVDPHAAALGTVHTDGTGAKAPTPAMASIVGGIAPERHEYPWQVGLRVDGSNQVINSGNIFCGGSILSSMTVLTAAHCIDQVGQTALNSQELEVMISQTLTQVSPLDQRIAVCSAEQHPEYDDTTKDNDFAILTLCSQIVFNPNVQPICLPSLPGKSYEGVQGTLAGWGATSTGGSQPTAILEANVTTITTATCNAHYRRATPAEINAAGFPAGTLTVPITDNMICAWREGKDACQGDSGGALVVQEPCGHFAQVGVVSFGLGCAVYPNVYSRVSQQINWISANLKGQSCPAPSKLV